MRLTTRLLLPPLALVALAGAPACSDEVPPAEAAESATAVEVLTPSEGMDLLATTPDAVVVDVRTPAEFAEGHLPGARNIDVQSPDFADRIAELDPAAPTVVYCRSGNRSAAAASTMASAGFTDLSDLGGIGAWQAAGGEVVTG